MEPNAQTRDYDKDPIVIEDYNPLFFVLLIVLVCIYFSYLFLVNPNNSHNTGSRIFWFAYFVGYIFLPTLTLHFYIRRNKRKVILMQNFITYQDDTAILEKIEVKEIVNINRIFNDYYRKEQNIHSDNLVRILINRILSPLVYTILLVNKVIFHLIKNGLSTYKVFDAILLSTEDGRIVNVFPTTKDEYESVKKYFLKIKGADISTVGILIKFDYRQEEKAK